MHVSYGTVVEMARSQMVDGLPHIVVFRGAMLGLHGRQATEDELFKGGHLQGDGAAKVGTFRYLQTYATHIHGRFCISLSCLLMISVP